MPPAARKVCDYPGCQSGPPGENAAPSPLITAENNITKEEVTADLKDHTERAHLLPLRLAENATKAREAEALVIQVQATLLREETNKIVAQTNASRSSSPGSQDIEHFSSDTQSG